MAENNRTSEKTSRRFYEMRGKCFGHNLDNLWEQIKQVDNAQAEAQEYAEEFSKNPEKYEKDTIFIRAMRLRMDKFDEELRKYQGIFVDKCHEEAIVFECEGRKVSLEEAVEEKDLTMRCKHCETEIPHLKYPGWNE